MKALRESFVFIFFVFSFILIPSVVFAEEASPKAEMIQTLKASAAALQESYPYFSDTLNEYIQLETQNGDREKQSLSVEQQQDIIRLFRVSAAILQPTHRELAEKLGKYASEKERLMLAVQTSSTASEQTTSLALS